MRKKSSGDKLHNNFICQSGFLSEYTKTMTLKMKSLMNITKILLVKLRKIYFQKRAPKYFCRGWLLWKVISLSSVSKRLSLPERITICLIDVSNQDKIIYNLLSWMAKNSFSIKEWVKRLLKKKQTMCRSEKKGVCRTN